MREDPRIKPPGQWVPAGRLSRMVMHFCVWILGSTAPTFAQIELFSTFAPGSYCSEAPLSILTLEPAMSCGFEFYQIEGRLAFPPLVNHGAVRVEALTMSPDTRTRFPLFFSVLSRAGSENLGCTTVLGAPLLFVAQGIPAQCGGVWESVGRIDLTRLGVPLGAPYHVQLEGFRGGGGGATAVAAVRVTTEPATEPIRGAAWAHIKQLYRDPGE